MRTRYKVALLGFNDSEHGALALCLQFSAVREVAYDEAADPAQAEFLIADADAEGVPERVRDGGRLRDTVFVGTRPVAGALSQVLRPIDPDAIVQELDELLALRGAEAAGLTVDIGLPLDERMPAFEQSARDAPPAALEPLDPAAPTSIERAGTRPPRTEPPLLQDALDAPGRAPGRHPSRAEGRAAARRARLRDSAAAAAAAPPDVLVLDDSEIALRYLCKLLGDFGFRAHPARDSAAAWELLSRQRFAVALLDVVLDEADEADGIALCHRLKQAPPDAPGSGAARVMLVSGSARPADHVRAQLAGCDAFLTKPISRGSLARALESCAVALPADARRR